MLERLRGYLGVLVVNILSRPGTEGCPPSFSRSSHYPSLDQTTRVHGPVSTDESSEPSWHELSRPQVHGYDLIDSVFLDATRFASIADEKVARVFEAPREFIDLVDNLRVASLAVNKVRILLLSNGIVLT